MNIVEYKSKLQPISRQTTLCFLTKENEILLAMKKRGFGVGWWNGVGGKQNPEEDILETAIRETREEIEVIPTNMEFVAVLNFYFLNNPEWNQQCSVYITKTWEGEPKETEEMRPQWYNKNELPFDAMWPNDRLWIPLVFGGSKLNADFLFDENNEMLDSNIIEVDTL
jgi:8-oxo-dGTP pyrophosphatase MutT (NUDIX family)